MYSYHQLSKPIFHLKSHVSHLTLTFTIDGTVTPGTKELKLNYQITDNEPITPPAPITMQGMTQSYCQNNMTIYDGSSPSAILTLTDTRADNQTYQVAKLADNNCWMLNNLKLGSNSGTTLLTPQDTDITSNFTLPQLYSGSVIQAVGMFRFNIS